MQKLDPSKTAGSSQGGLTPASNSLWLGHELGSEAQQGGQPDVFGQQSVLGEFVQMLAPNGSPPITGSSQGGYSAVQVESVQQGGKPLVLGKQVTLMIRKKE